MADADDWNPGADFAETWGAVSQQLTDLDLDGTQSLRATTKTVLLDGPGPSELQVGELPLLSSASSGATSDLIPTRVLGEGGMGKVELAIQRSLRREVALKSILGEEDDGANAAALMQEALFTGLLEHPNIVPVHQLGRSA
ncbi:MAG: hypothetical protein KDD82_16995, partial [Planctomycetes bacterium]|nr:hypothetical protein [Planctomycetota bacterium]